MIIKTLYDSENSEWASRLTIQIFNLSPPALLDPKREKEFREVHKPLYQSMTECYDARLELNRLVEKHLQDVADGRCAQIVNGHLTLTENIEPALNRVFKDFFVKARTVLYHLFGQKSNKGQKSVTEVLLGHEMGFVQIDDDAKFERKAQEFLQKTPGEGPKHLIEMFRGDRKTWSSGLIDIRNTIIHDVSCPHLEMRYAVVQGAAHVAFPTVHSTELREFVGLFWENLCDCVEETIVACFSIVMPAHFIMFRIADEARDPQCPMRWQIGIRPLDVPAGVIVGMPPKAI